MKQNLFELTKNITLDDLKSFAAAHGGEFGRDGNSNKNECYCPFHAHEHDTPSLHFKQPTNGVPFWHCFACDMGGDIVKWAEHYLKLKPLEAAEVVLDFFKIPYEKKRRGS